MRLILNGLNGEYLREILLTSAEKTEEVWAAVAYASNDELVEWCLDKGIKLKFFGRLDEDVAVSTPILDKFLKHKRGLISCSLVKHHHAKVIWWKGVGVYIGSANLSNLAWYSNIEAGWFHLEDELSVESIEQISSVFSELERRATPLTEELYELMKRRAAEKQRVKFDTSDFWSSTSIRNWEGLAHTSRRNASATAENQFLEEWYSTLQLLRNLSELVAARRPNWVEPDVAQGAQVDQFLHAHYYHRTFDGRKSDYNTWFDRNSYDPRRATEEALDWWENLPSAPYGEDEVLNVRSKLLKTKLERSELSSWEYLDFLEVSENVHSISEYARRVANSDVGLPGDRPYSIAEKTKVLTKRIWDYCEASGTPLPERLHRILYGGTLDDTPRRLWEAVTEPRWKVPGLGISALGELTGWAKPDRFPPRNGRTSKSLRSLGYDVKVHVGA